MADYTSQIQILHFSDLHFGGHHICNAEFLGSGKGIPSLGELISKDLQTDFGATVFDNTDYSSPENLPFEHVNYASSKEAPLIMVVSGDFTQQAAHKEFEQASDFLNKILSSKSLNRNIDKKNVFMVPGNHDVQFTSDSVDERFQSYCQFYNKFYQNIRPANFAHEAGKLTQVHIHNDNGNKFIVAEINCCMYVEKDKIDSSRGHVDFESIKKLRQDLEEMASGNSDFNEYIKIAVIHHHVVLLPSFIEKKRGIDSIENSGHLLELLSNYDFHLILHGHKHYPHIFNYEPVPLWNQSKNKIPQIVIAGGSCGSKELPTDISTHACNTYGVITIKWHPAAKQGRVNIITRGLKRVSSKPLTPDQWKWETVNISDKIITPYQSIPAIGATQVNDLDDDDARRNQYKIQRYAMPVAEVMPSLIPGQAYEVRAWIVFHKPDLNKTSDLVRVEWTAGEMFKRVVCLKENNPNFSFSYHYWGSMLIQAKLIFSDGHEALAYVYARIPKDESSPPNS